jgi:threonine dehydratase
MGLAAEQNGDFSKMPYTSMRLTLDQIYQARRNLRGVALPVPFTWSRGLSGVSGGHVYLKWENLQRTGSFKIRGAVHKMLKAERGTLAKGVVTASAGNHSQAVAFGGQILGITVTTVMPVSTPGVKVENTKRLGAEVVLFGENYDEAHERCMELAASTGMTYIAPCEDLDVMAGHGTIGLEILESQPDTDIILVPVGGGGLISGIAIAAKAIHPEVRIIGVQPTQACTMFRCFRAGRMVEVPVVPTLAEGLAGGVEEMNFEIVRETVDDMVLVSEERLAESISWVLTTERQVVEASGVVGVAAILENRIPDIRKRNTVVVISGGNIDVDLLRRVASGSF